MTRNQLKQGLKRTIKNTDNYEVEHFCTEALHVIKMQEKEIELKDKLIETYKQADREAMIGSIDV